MSKLLQSQLSTSAIDNIKNILQNHQVEVTLKSGDLVTANLIYLPCLQDGKSSHEVIFEAIKEDLLQNFAFSYKEISKKKEKNNDKHVMDNLLKKAIRKLSQHTSKGELGELLLFLLIEAYLSAPKIFSKISGKTDSRMPVFGADAIHGQFINDKFIIFLGESKLYKNFKRAAYDAAQSIFTAKKNFNTEFDLLDSDLDFQNISDELEVEILSVLDPYNENDETYLDHIHSPCFIGFTQPDILLANQSDYLKQYQLLAEEYVKYFFNRIISEQLLITEVTLLMLPFTCVDQLVDDFIKYFGIQK